VVIDIDLKSKEGESKAMSSDLTIWLSDWLTRLSDDLEIRLLPSKRQLFSREKAALEAFIDGGIADKQNVYFGVLGREGKAGAKENVKEAHCLWADIDFKDLQEGKAEADGIVATFDHSPSLLISTGGGYHLYWFLDKPTVDLARVERILKGLVPRLKADIKAAEIARVLRAPESRNWKYDPPRRVDIEEFNGNTYSLDDFKEWELPEEPERLADMGIESEERIDVRRYLKQYKVPVVKVKPQGTATMFCLKLCLFDENHTEKGRENEAAIVQGESGKLSYQCFHGSCQGRKWAEAREKISGNDAMTPFIMRDLRPLVEKYVGELTGETSIGALHSWYDVKTITERQESVSILNEMAAKRVIVWVGRKHGIFRPVDKNPQIMILGMPKRDRVSIHLPFNLHTLVNLYPRNIVMCAGEKDAGKTTFALNAAYANRDRIHVTYFNSEMGPEELEARLVLFPDARLSEWRKITWIERASRFEDFIDPDGFNIIDFLEVGADAYAVVEDIKRVFDRLMGGVLLIVMQKRSYKEWAVGGEGTLEKARLAVNLERRAGIGNVCRITVAKNWTGVIRHPRGYECLYKIYRGGKMEMNGEWYDPDALAVLEGKKERGMPSRKKKDRDFVPE
jgi:hypothetical protein